MPLETDNGTSPTVAEGTGVPDTGLAIHDQQRALAREWLARPQNMAGQGEHDYVTGLPTRRQFLIDYPDRDTLAEAGPLMLVTLATASHYNQLLRVLGHDSADSFVVQGARRLREVLPDECGRVYHVSVMSFAFCLPKENEAMAEQVSRTILDIFDVPVHCDDIPVDVNPGLGILDTARRAFDPAEALRAVMTAAQASRMQEETSLRSYDAETDAAFRRTFMLLTDLRRELADDTGQLSLHYQPRIELASGRCIGAEALIRWNHPTLGMIPPAEFVPLAEATALITPLTRFVLRRAAAGLHDWRETGIDLAMSVNISPANLSEPDFIDNLLARVDMAGVERNRFELEFTEGVLNDNKEQVLARLHKLVAEGIEIAIDDFGSGYSNLSYIADLPASVLKIDQSFIRPMDDNRDKQRLVRSVLNLAHSFDFRVVAEGIETAKSLSLLTGWGVEEGQGFHIARPMTPDAFTVWLATRRQAH